MKTMKIFMLLAFFSFAANAQDLKQNEVPNELMSTFENEFSGASDIEWEKSRDGFNVEFDLNRIDHEVWYSAAGEKLKMEKEVREPDFPTAIKNTLKNKYSGFRVEDAEMRKEGNTTNYQVELEKGNDEKVLLFDESGNIVEEWRD